jgi:hypothetical protein
MRGVAVMSDGIILRNEVRPSHPAGDQLMRGLIFLRANTMNMIRLQLAMERGDRRAALQTVDELVALDAQIRDLVEAGAAGTEISQMQRDVDQQRLTLSLEKLALAAGIRSRGQPAERTWSEPTRTAAPSDFSADGFAAIDAMAVDSDAAYVTDDVRSHVGPVTQAGKHASSKRRPLRILGLAGPFFLLCAMILGALLQGAALPLIADWLSKGSAAWPM